MYAEPWRATVPAGGIGDTSPVPAAGALLLELFCLPFFFSAFEAPGGPAVTQSRSLTGDTSLGTPKKRAMKPQRVSSPAGGLLGGATSALGARKGNYIHLQLYHLGDAILLHEDWPDHLEATGLLWTTEDGAHLGRDPQGARWGNFLKQEGLNEDVLLRDYMIISRAASRPPYAKCLTIAGDPTQALNLVENYISCALQLPEFANTPCEVILHNSTHHSFDEWQAETALPTLKLGCPQYEALLATQCYDLARLQEDFLVFEDA